MAISPVERLDPRCARITITDNGRSFVDLEYIAVATH
jgi:hypothetical protein